MQLYTSQLHTQIIWCGNFDIWFHYSCARNQGRVGKKTWDHSIADSPEQIRKLISRKNPGKCVSRVWMQGMDYARNGVGWNHHIMFFFRKTLLREQDELRNVGWILESDWDSLRDFWRAQTQHYLVQRRGASRSDPCSTLFCTGEQFFIYQVNISLNLVWKLIKFVNNPFKMNLNEFSYMRREDSGMFQCSGFNEGGYVTGYTWLRVKSKYFQIVYWQ